jgi:hypothetical protein
VAAAPMMPVVARKKWRRDSAIVVFFILFLPT